MDENDDPYIMVIKRGYATGLTVERLNTIRSAVRSYFEDRPPQDSMEVTVLPRDRSGPFSIHGDSGSAVVDGKGRLVGLLTGGVGLTDATDCTYITSINFILERMLEHGFRADLRPQIDD